MDEIDEIRAFNRFYTRELGFLSRSYLGSGLGVGEVRVLYEVAHAAPATARELAERLALDEGYLSRVLKGFERRGWIARHADTGDARRRRITLTAAGGAAMAPLEARSRAEVAARLGKLNADARAGVLAGAVAMRRGLGDPDLPAPPLTFSDLAPGDAGWIISRHGALYAQDEGYDLSFEGLVAGIVAGFIRSRDPARERAWVARSGELRIGCIFCVRESDDVARLRLFLLEPAARGRGAGRKMLDLCLTFARQAGYTRIVLWTHESHRAACALYASAGFRMTSESPGVAFGQAVVDQTWERAL
ncbi:bifunctional helix-turn-helix transcriptional regulator/GNAT family N-acetyltransferase [Defluviimonas sp. SAOS-178_SWC]|uniref:bifunctional helix-turn-helix transcriptional regulator/GNAT family N-acetyltransferase n=1 Tax=Defluviimonas sp. SAOS-178_SWC TaxID=3121287 RepID=UPI0032217B16